MSLHKKLLPLSLLLALHTPLAASTGRKPTAYSPPTKQKIIKGAIAAGVGILAIIGIIGIIGSIGKKTNNPGDQNNLEDQNNPVEDYKVWLEGNPADKKNFNAPSRLEDEAKPMMDAIKTKVAQKDPGQWRTWVVQKDEETIAALKRYLRVYRYDITDYINVQEMNVPALATLSDKVVYRLEPLVAAYVTNQLLCLLEEVVGAQRAQEIIQAQDDFFLGALVRCHQHATPGQEEKITQVNFVTEYATEGHNTIPTIHVLLAHGANPTSTPPANITYPLTGSLDEDNEYKGDNSIKEFAASRDPFWGLMVTWNSKEKFNCKIDFTQKNNKWVVNAMQA